MTQAPRLNARLIIFAHDGGSNPRNPYDRFTPQEREKKIVELCARIYVRMRSENAESPSSRSDEASAGTPSVAALDHRSEPEASGGAR